MEYDEALQHLDALINYEVIPRAGAIEGLTIEPMRALMAALGDPHTSYPVIHVTGTNGKGSSIRLIEAILLTMGLRVGTYTSPHLETVNERIRVAGDAIDDVGFAQAVGDVVRTQDAYRTEPITWFETLTAAALLHFANEVVEVALVEVGMLGRYDATNVVEAEIAVITNVGFDHTVGGPGWRATIAAEKSGIIEPNSLLVLGENDETRAVFMAENPGRVVVRDDDFAVTENLLAVGGRQASIRTPRGSYDEIFLNLHGAHQAENAALALTVAEEFFAASLPPDVVEEAFGTVLVPGRLEIVRRSPLIVVDTAHNVSAAAVLAEAVADFGLGGRRFLLIGLQDGRVAVDVCRALRVGDYQLVVACTAPTNRGLEADVLAAAVRSAGGYVDAVGDVDAALDYLLSQAEDDDLVVVTGSNAVVGRIRSSLSE